MPYHSKKKKKKAAESFSFLRENLEEQQNLSSEYFQFSRRHPSKGKPQFPSESCLVGRAPGHWERGSATQAWLLCAEGGTAASLMSQSLALQRCSLALRWLWMHARDLQMEGGGQKAGPQMLRAWLVPTGMQQPLPAGMFSSSTRPR